MIHRLAYASRGPWTLEHGSILSGDFARLRRDGFLTDVCLKVKDRSFSAHKVVLAAMSPYFQKVFESGLAEAREDKIDLQDIEANIVDEILSFMYTGKAKIQGFEQAVDMLVAADRYLMTDLALLTLQLIKLRAKPGDMPKLLADARRFRNEDLEAFAYVKYLQHFQDVSDSLTHLPCDVLCEALESDFLVVESEVQVLDAVVTWLEANGHSEAGTVVPIEEKSRLLSTVRFNLIEPSLLPGFWPRIFPHCQDFVSAQHILCGLGRAGGDSKAARWILRDASTEDLGQVLFDFALMHYEYGSVAALIKRLDENTSREPVRKYVLTLLQDAFDTAVERAQERGSAASCSRTWALFPWAGLVPSLIIEDLLPFKSVRRDVLSFLKEENHEESQVLLYEIAYAVVLRCDEQFDDIKQKLNARACMEELVEIMQHHVTIAEKRWAQLILQRAAQKVHNVLSLSSTSPTEQ